VPLEIERKFLVGNDGWRTHSDGGRRLIQAYLAETDRAVVRVRIEDAARAVMTVKSAVPGLTRQEFEYPIPPADAEALATLRQGAMLEKHRFLVPHGGRRWEVDVYAGENAGLVLAEIELECEAAEFERPPWLGAEVTSDARYYASRLSRNPFSAWGQTRSGPPR
jgi:adenylate cyclase